MAILRVAQRSLNSNMQTLPSRTPARPALRPDQLKCRAAQAGLPGDRGVPPPKDAASLSSSDPIGASNERAASGLAASTSKLLEAPRSVVMQLVSGYQHALDKHPVATKALTSFVGFCIGDRIAQAVGGAAYDPLRALRLSAYGLFIDGPVGHYFYQLLDKYIKPDAPKSNEAVITKTAVDQLIWAPVMTVVFLTFLTTLEGRPEQIMGVVQSKLLPIMLANFSVWPVAHLVNFKYVAPDQRILFNNVVAIAWTTYLSATCGPTAGHSGTPRDALMAGIPCAAAAAASVLQSHHVTDALRHTSAMETMLQGWGTRGMPAADAGTELIMDYIRIKAEVVRAVCSVPGAPLG